MRTTRLNVLLASTVLAVALPGLAAAQDNVRADVISLPDWHPDVYVDGLSVEKMLGTEVKGPTGDDIGRVENVLFGEDGRVLSVVAEVGGVLEMGDTHVNIPWDMVSSADWDEGIEIPITQETIEDYTFLTDDYVTRADTQEVQEVGGDSHGAATTGPQVWRATDYIGDITRLRKGEEFVDYGYVDDVIIKDGKIAAVVVGPGAGLDAQGYHALPYSAGDPNLGYYDLPYEAAEVQALEPFNRDASNG